MRQINLLRVKFTKKQLEIKVQEQNVVSVVETNQHNFMCLIFVYFSSSLIDLGFEFDFFI